VKSSELKAKGISIELGLGVERILISENRPWTPWALVTVTVPGSGKPKWALLCQLPCQLP